MMTIGAVKGVDVVVDNLNRVVLELEAKGTAGIIKFADFLFHQMDSVPPMIPVDTGELRSSWFVDVESDGSVMMGFSVPYAGYVHESVGRRFQRPGAGAKFFDAALKRNRRKLMKILGQEMVIT